MDAAFIRESLKRAYRAPGYALAFEVSTGTGARARRYVDAVLMDLWPSRGLRLTAVEIKVSRKDFWREMKQPEKSEAVAKWCDHFAIAAPMGMLKPGDLPIEWGLFEVTTRGRLAVTVSPRDRPKVQPVDRDFLAAMMRAAGRTRFRPPASPAEVEWEPPPEESPLAPEPG